MLKYSIVVFQSLKYNFWEILNVLSQDPLSYWTYILTYIMFIASEKSLTVCILKTL